MIGLKNINPPIYDGFDGDMKDTMTLEYKMLNEIILLNPIGEPVEFTENDKTSKGKVVGGNSSFLMVETETGSVHTPPLNLVKFL